MKIKHLPILIFSLFLFSKNAHAQDGVRLSAKVFLQGALIDNPFAKTLMRDDLREKGFLPVSEPYTGMPRYEHLGSGGAEAIADESVFEVESKDAIVDWMYIELRNADDRTEVLATRSAVLQRDGDVVDMDGVSPLFFEGVEEGEYHIAMRHRNHLGMMTQHAVELTAQTLSVDFSDPDFETWGEHAQIEMDGVMTMWMGDMNQDGATILQGLGNDLDSFFLTLLLDEGNISGNFNHYINGYTANDVDLNGRASIAGVDNDRGKIFIHVIGKATELFGNYQNWP